MTAHLLHLIAGALVLAAFLVWFEACARLGILKQWHHIWFSVPLLLMPWSPCWLLAAFIACDDAMQHARQRHDSAYLSPLHRLWGAVALWLYRQSWLPKSLRERLVA